MNNLSSRSRRIIVLALLAIVAVGIFGYRMYMERSRSDRVYHIGILVRGSGYDSAVAGFKARMAELGYKEGVTVTYDTQFIADKSALLGVARRFIEERVDVVHTYSTPATEAAIQATKEMNSTTPIVFGSVGDPLLLSAVSSIDHPGANVTGITSLSTDLTGKRIELLKEVDPAIRVVAMPHTATEAGDLSANKSVDIARRAAKEIGVSLVEYPVASSADNAVVAKKILRTDVGGIIVGGDSLVWNGIDAYIKQAISEKIPLSVFSVSQVQSGALMAIGPDYAVSGRQSADMVNKILRGANPANIPVEVPNKLIFVINQDTARKIGVVFSPALLQKADIVISTPSQ